MIFTQKWVFLGFSTAHPPQKPSGWVGKWEVVANPDQNPPTNGWDIDERRLKNMQKSWFSNGFFYSKKRPLLEIFQK
jgi:hypothetical protein